MKNLIDLHVHTISSGHAYSTLLENIAFAKNNNLFVTVGSDFHRKDNSHPQIGFTNMSFKLEENVINKIIQNIET